MKKRVWCWYEGKLCRLLSVHNTLAVLRPRFGPAADLLVDVRKISWEARA